MITAQNIHTGTLDLDSWRSFNLVKWTLDRKTSYFVSNVLLELDPTWLGVGGFFSLCLSLFFFNPHWRTCLLTSERGQRREGGRERENIRWERSIDRLLCKCPGLGWYLQPRHVPWLGIEPVNPRSMGRRSNHLSHPLRAFVSPEGLAHPCCWLDSFRSPVSKCASFRDRQGKPTGSQTRARFWRQSKF